MSYDHGFSSEPLLGRTLGDHFDLMASKHAEAEALVSCHQNIRWTYAQLKEKVSLFARGLLSLGIESGDRVGVWSTNNVEWVIAQLATAKIGSILVNINPAYRTHELEYCLAQAGIKLLITMPGFKGDEYLKMLQEVVPQLFVDSDHQRAHADGATASVRRHHLETIVVIGADQYSGRSLRGFESVVRAAKDVSAEVLAQRGCELQFDDPINIQYTSGTTGYPKGVMLTHHNLLNNALYCGEAMGLTPESRFCVPVPFYHCAGMVLCTLATLSRGGTLVIPSPSFKAASALACIQSERCTHLAGVPTMFITELEEPDFANYDLSTLKGGFMAGAPCPVQLMRKVEDLMNARELVIFYGQTEASPVITSTTSSDSMERRAGSVGRVVPNMELKIIDTESGNVVPRGTQGEICARGYGIMPGYWENPAASREAIDSHGWLHTGDLGTIDGAGYVNITGRKKDMIIRGGQNIYPREIEEVLHTHAEIAQAQVFGVPDGKYGEEVAVWLQLKNGSTCQPEDIQSWLRARVAHYNVPRYVKCVESYPMTVTGKIQKFAMRDEMIKELGLLEAANIQTA